MNLLTNESAALLWERVIKDAEASCSITLDKEHETYLVSLLIRHTNQPDFVQRVIATSFLQAMREQFHQRNFALQQVGDQCLLYAGLFPESAEKRLVKIDYFVDLGRSAYAAISGTASELYNSLAVEFVLLTDVLQSIRQETLTPFEAYEQWRLTGSKRALTILNQYAGVILPLRRS